MFARLTFAASLLSGIAAITTSAGAQTLNRWVQYGPNNTVFVRSISAAGTAACPPLTIDGATQAMSQRFAPSSTYPILECEVQLPLGTYTMKQAVLDGVALKMPVANPRRILVIGDTGCRVNGGTPQDCNNVNGPLDYPLASLGAYAATFNPDMIIHSGDFYYREKDASPSCTGANANVCGIGPGIPPVGEVWTSWNADWFTPASVLMQAAPMALTRGNHESCNRGAVGWFHTLAVQALDASTNPPTPTSAYLDAAANCGVNNGYAAGSYRNVSTSNPNPGPIDPNDLTPAYVVQAGPIALIMFDISYSNDSVYESALVTPGGLASQTPSLQSYADQLSNALALTQGKPAFFVAHKPVFGINGGTTTLPGSGYLAGGNVNEQQVFANSSAGTINLFVSGHTHNFQVVDVTGSLIPQLVIGNSGVQLDGQQVPLGSNLTHVTYQASNGTPTGNNDAVGTNSYQSTYLNATNDFGFAVLDQVNDASGKTTGYTANIYNLHSNRAGRCNITLATATTASSMICTR